MQRPADEPGSACAWIAAGALSDALDVVASLSSWRELPRISRLDYELKTGHVVTIEPGLYYLGRGAVRIEDMVEVTADGKRLWLSGRFDNVVYDIDTATGEVRNIVLTAAWTGRSRPA